ncbi:hypothetical protein KSP39_PZI023952 [Platanthera zijinensis]|uniref:phosphoglycolate phosphatase n=1 Tax=Platanthera zijinensis TaxID=2320716 RepID=A0AAP0AU48_9ASPA
MAEENGPKITEPEVAAATEDGKMIDNGAGKGSAHRELTSDGAADLIRSIDAFLLDCDGFSSIFFLISSYNPFPCLIHYSLRFLPGVIWKGDKLIDGVPEALRALRSMVISMFSLKITVLELHWAGNWILIAMGMTCMQGKRLVFVTNNSTKSRRQYARKFASLGLDVNEDEIFSSSFASAMFLKLNNFPRDKKIYVIGEEGILEELELAGFTGIGGPVGAVIVGLDQYINYYKLQYATLCIRENPGCLFIATNRDAVGHLTDLQEWPGAGCMVAAVCGAVQKEPVVVGKPSTFLMDFLTYTFVCDVLDSMTRFEGESNGLFTVCWSIEADIGDNQLIFLTGDLVSLGCWNPDKAVLLSPSTEGANLWYAEIQGGVLQGEKGAVGWGLDMGSRGPAGSLGLPEGWQGGSSRGGGDRAAGCGLARGDLAVWRLGTRVVRYWIPDAEILKGCSCKEVTSSGSVWDFMLKLVSSGNHFKYNYFLKNKKQLENDLIWRPGPTFSLSIPLENEEEDIVVRDSWMRTRLGRWPIPSWGSWMLDMDLPVGHGHHINQAIHETPSAGDQEISSYSNESLSSEKHLLVSYTSKTSMFEENDVSVSSSSLGAILLERDQPVEEPWLLRSTLLSMVEFKELDVSSKQENSYQIESSENLCGETQKTLPEEIKLAYTEKPVWTVILINSSLCTMQRIAVLENGKLVELLLEPVKDNVQCDSIYLGVVTKLAPHMGGAFVNIGISRPSFMDIKQNREPFVFPLFQQDIKKEFVNGFASTGKNKHSDINEIYQSSDDEDGIDTVTEVDHEEESLHFTHEDFEDPEADDAIDVVAVSRNMSGAGNFIGVENYSEELEINGSPLEDEVVEDHITLQAEQMNDSNFPLLMQASRKSNNSSSADDKWANVCKGTKVIVQVVKEGLGTKDGKNWTVAKFVEEHNHPLASEKEQYLLRSHRKKDEELLGPEEAESDFEDVKSTKRKGRGVKKVKFEVDSNFEDIEHEKEKMKFEEVRKKIAVKSESRLLRRMETEKEKKKVKRGNAGEDWNKMESRLRVYIREEVAKVKILYEEVSEALPTDIINWPINEVSVSWEERADVFAGDFRKTEGADYEINERCHGLLTVGAKGCSMEFCGGLGLPTVLITRCDRIGVSKKITGIERARLRAIARTLQPPGFGLTARTVESLIIDSPRTYHEVTSYLQEIAPDLCQRVRLYDKRTPIFDEYNIEEEINNILSKRVPLSNGGSLVIEQTEALVSIDVNGGHGMS